MKFAIPSPVTETSRAPRRSTIVCDVATDTRDAALAVIKDAILNHPRTLQKRIGPSEIGDPCDFCLGCRLAELDQEIDLGWLPFIGTAVHEKLETIFNGHKSGEWLTEQRVKVGKILDVEIHGNSDLFFVTNSDVVDWKIVGKKRLDEARLSGGPGEPYRSQAHFYGKGFKAKGHDVKHVCIFFLPRNSRDLDDAIWWAEEYDEQIALKALDRANRLALEIETFGAEIVVPGLNKLEGCYDCPRWILPWEEDK